MWKQCLEKEEIPKKEKASVPGEGSKAEQIAEHCLPPLGSAVTCI